MAFTLLDIENGEIRSQKAYSTLEEAVQEAQEAAVVNTPSPSRIVWMPFGAFMTFSSDEELKKGFITREHIHEGLESDLAKQAREANIAKLPDEASKIQASAIPQSRLVLWLHGNEYGETPFGQLPPDISCLVIQGVPQKFAEHLEAYFPESCSRGKFSGTFITTSPFKPKFNFLQSIKNAWAGVKGFLALVLGKHSTGARNWFLLFMLTLLGLGLLGAFLPAAPLAAVIAMKLGGVFFLTEVYRLRRLRYLPIMRESVNQRPIRSLGFRQLRM